MAQRKTDKQKIGAVTFRTSKMVKVRQAFDHIVPQKESSFLQCNVVQSTCACGRKTYVESIGCYNRVR
eukprot:snap_masked-scaffold_6-processed-gene-19.14-mRNA-1 protein AED:1.00 eAED:1.00 QI:0/-1/0/0/-1/1/1/0/67